MTDNNTPVYFQSQAKELRRLIDENHPAMTDEHLGHCLYLTYIIGVVDRPSYTDDQVAMMYDAIKKIYPILDGDNPSNTRH